ncbi:hypothetical protein BDQ17DRAFT_1430873 [Cyathus striatus]|nr:hypothetical protein BDQ17DRAFT_1430873 [Cyathus striatus]
MSASHFPQSTSQQSIDENERLRLMALLALYDLLPHSISHPPDREEPLYIENAVDSESFLRCFSAVSHRDNVRSLEDALEEIKRLTSTTTALHDSPCQRLTSVSTSPVKSGALKK